MVSVGDRGFWAMDDAFSEWFTCLADQIELESAQPWLRELAELWRVAALVSDYGARFPSPSAEQLRVLHAIAVEARRRVTDDRVLEVADGFLGLLDGTLPLDPPEGAWFLGTGRGFETIELDR